MEACPACLGSPGFSLSRGQHHAATYARSERRHTTHWPPDVEIAERLKAEPPPSLLAHWPVHLPESQAAQIWRPEVLRARYPHLEESRAAFALHPQP